MLAGGQLASWRGKLERRKHSKLTPWPRSLPPSLAHRLGGRINTYTLKHGDQERKVDLGATFVCGGWRGRCLFLLSTPLLAHLPAPSTLLSGAMLCCSMKPLGAAT